ncbi:MAG: hypothetical protein M3371_10255 [Acidobacteriota bacterium]|nr:hypothetical protein [Acidobacteriota bacterium]
MCWNFIEARQIIYPDEVLRLFDQLGVNYKREAEAYHMTRLDSGLHLYGAWLHFLVQIELTMEIPWILKEEKEPE